MIKRLFVLAGAAVVLAMPSSAPVAQQTAGQAILPGPLAKLDIKEAQIELGRGKPQGTLTVAQHFALDPGWLNQISGNNSGPVLALSTLRSTRAG